MCLPTPGYSFSIPSVYDDTTLDCRLYHPKQHQDLNQPHATKAAIVAHPYGPLGGCYDDPVVSSIGKALLDAGYIVGTFNFRGAGGSAGHTSWSAKPELADYVSFYGFMLSYLNCIQPSGSKARCVPEPGAVSVPASPPGQDSTELGARQAVQLILAGYSYGSMIASHLPTLDFVLNMFHSPPSDSAEAEVRLRASNLAQLRSRDVQARLRQEQHGRGRGSLKVSDPSHGNSHAISVGGYESESASRRISRELSRKSIDVGVRKSLDRVRERFVSRKSSSHEDFLAETMIAPDVWLVTPEICYLLVSPLLPPVALLTTMFTTLSFPVKKQPSSAPTGETAVSKRADEFAFHPSCAVFGDQDTFTSQKKLRKWAENLKQRPDSQFQFFEVDGAGHFWHERTSAERMKSSVNQWLGVINVL